MAQQPPTKKRILVVDDDEAIRTMVGKALQAKGYDVMLAKDGLEASEMLGKKPDLLICDVMMPNFDGFTLAKLVKAHAELRAMPIIFLTAKAQPKDVATGISLGARHYLTKPFSIKDLLDKVDKTVQPA
ncbi:MAG TPA: response regulator transcription factor [Polyangiaceae bacterium]|nr:response regulator transcription factor [Polyangiaceae bacterium]